MATRSDKKFFVWSVLQSVNALLLAFVAFGVMFWRGDSKIRQVQEIAQFRIDEVVSNACSVVSNAILLATLKFEEEKIKVEGMLTNGVFNASFESETNKDTKVNVTLDSMKIARAGNHLVCQLNDIPHNFRVGDIWLDESRITEITDYYVLTQKSIYFSPPLRSPTSPIRKPLGIKKRKL